ncbi:hypothetical protein EH223_00415 [candidate division KSB1 bacterium]|nr:hypothetical protein [candidate division KSB1 bacterium]RQW07114.1 MAG: hypothetical protein EH223_00415 [candidate division KSB1 bacterium]
MNRGYILFAQGGPKARGVRASQDSRHPGCATVLPELKVDFPGDYRLSHADEESNNSFSIGSSTTSNTAGRINLNWTLFDGFAMFVDNQQWRELEKSRKTH